MPSKAAKANFAGGLEVNEPIILNLYVSPDNEKQAGDNLEAFVDLVNKEKQKIKKLVVIDTSYLRRHYDHKFSNTSIKSDWLKANEQYLKNLKVEYEVISYQTITKTLRYEYFQKKIKSDFEGNNEGLEVDEVFRQKVLQLLEEFTYKGSKQSVTKFLLDECAGNLAAGEGYYTYSGKFNAAIEHVRNKYKDDIQNQVFIRYRLRPKSPPAEPEEKKSTLSSQTAITGNSFIPVFTSNNYTNYTPTFFGQSVAYFADSLVPESPKKKAMFFAKFMQLCQEFNEDEDKLPQVEADFTNTSKGVLNNGPKFN